MRNVSSSEFLRLSRRVGDISKKEQPQTGKNYIINGNFDIWQRGTSQTSSGYISDDRWINQHFGSSKTHSRQSFTAGQTDVPHNPKYFSRTVITSAAGAPDYVFKTQKIEDVNTHSDETVVLTFWAKADAVKNIAIEFNQNFGSGGSTSIYEIGAQKISLTTSWAKYEVAVAIPGISGKTVGADSYLSFRFWFEAGSDYNDNTDSLGNQSGTFDIAQVKLEKGSTATEYVPKSMGEELLACQRYYWRGTLANASGIYYGIAGNGYHAGSLSFPVSMRKTPTVSVISAPTYINCSNILPLVETNGILLRVTVAGAGAYRAISGVYSADAEL